jgi:hypothetical protein
VPRGTLETVFKYTPYDELGASASTPTPKRACASAYPKLTGMLVVDDVQPGSGADGKLSPATFWWHRRQAHSGILRSRGCARQSRRQAGQGGSAARPPDGAACARRAVLERHHADEYIEFGEAVVHTLSYQQARHFNVPIKGVYVANPGYVFGSAGIPHAPR